MIQGAAFRVLACFYDTDEISFVDLCSRAGYPTDLGGYYLRQLIKSGYLEKVDRGRYRVLPEGKLQIALYYGKHILQSWPRLSVVVVVRQTEKYLALRRRVQPFLNVIEWPAGVVNSGEPLSNAASRICKKRLGVDVSPTFLGFFRRTDLYKDKPFDDKLFAVHTCELNAGDTFQPGSETGENLLRTKTELAATERRGRALLDILEYVEAGRSGLEEHVYTLHDEDFGDM